VSVRSDSEQDTLSYLVMHFPNLADIPHTESLALGNPDLSQMGSCAGPRNQTHLQTGGQ
jgi:hypothetical protein